MGDGKAVNELLSLWDAGREEGHEVAPEELCRDRPELLGELCRRIEALRAFDPLLQTRVQSNTSEGTGPGGASVRPSPKVAGYEVLEELGRGGMGVVYKARDLRLKRLVALKMILAGAHAGAAQRERFRREAEAVARLQHPNIVQVFELGEQDGLPFFAAELVEGDSLDRHLGGTPQPPREAARLIQVLASAVDAAHRAGVVHRDLKPANVLLAFPHPPTPSPKEGEGGPEGLAPPLPFWERGLGGEGGAVPKIADFGLAKQFALGEEGTASHPTQSGAVLGTPSYMAPEQAAGRGEVGPAADTYALGVILYEMLTGAPPFRGTSVLDTLEQVVAVEPVPPSRLQRSVPRDLETICLKCLHKAPGRRYPSAAALADDLGRFLAGEPIQARPVGRVERAVKWARRRPVVAALLALVVALTAGGGSLVVWKWAEAVANANAYRLARDDAEQSAKGERAAHARADEQRQVAEGATGEAKAALARARAALYLQSVALANRDWYGGNAARARDVLASAPADQRRWEWHYLDRLGRAHLFAWSSRSGKSSGPLPRRAWLRQVRREQGKRFPELLALDRAFCPDGTRYADADSRKGTLRLLDAETGRVVHQLTGHPRGVASVAFSPDGKRLASAGHDRLVRVHDVATGKVVATCAGHARDLRAIAFSPDGALLASSDMTGAAKLWRSADGKFVRDLQGKTNGVSELAFRLDGRYLASGAEDNTVAIWEVSSGKRERRLYRHEGPVYAVAFSPDNNLLASASADQTVKLWNTGSGQEFHALRGHTRLVGRVAFSADSQRVASASLGDATDEVRVWDSSQYQEMQAFFDANARANQLAVSDDGKRALMLAGGWFERHRASAIDVETASGRSRKHFNGAPHFLAGALSPDGARVALAWGDARALDKPGGVQVFDVATGKLAFELNGHKGLVYAVAFSPDGKRLATAGRDLALKLWDAGTGKETRCLSLEPFAGRAWHRIEQVVGPKGDVDVVIDYHGPGSVTFSTDGNLLAAVLRDGGIFVLDLANGKVAHSGGHTGQVYALAFNRDGLLASAGHDGTAQLWRPFGPGARTLRAHRGPVLSVAFSPDGRRLLSTGKGEMKLWEPASGEELLTLPRQTGAVRAAAFTRDGRLLTGNASGHLMVYDGSPAR